MLLSFKIQLVWENPYLMNLKEILLILVDVKIIVDGGEGEAHRLLSAPLTLSANVFTSLPKSQFTVNGPKMSTIL